VNYPGIRSGSSGNKQSKNLQEIEEYEKTDFSVDETQQGFHINSDAIINNTPDSGF
jgi:hypothetical protein